jgi:hypothetical protein
MADSFVCAQKDVDGRGRCCPSFVKYQACQIAPSDGTPAAATTTSSDFGRRRFMDSFKVTNLPPVVGP